MALASDNKSLSSDLKIVITLWNHEELSAEEISKKADIDLSTFYRNRRILIEKGVINKIEDKYVLWTHREIDIKVEDALKELNEEYIQVTLLDIANKVGSTPEEIGKAAFRLASKYSLKIGEKNIIKADISIAR
jgi:DNA-binding MarR family transcriptional regulator